MNKPSALLKALAGIILILITTHSQAQSLKSAAKEINAEFEQQTITAKVPLKFKAKYHVTSNGDTWGKDSSQGNKSGLSRSGEMAFSEGDTVKQLYVSAKSDSKILVRAFCCGNSSRGLFSTTQHADIYIHPDPPLTAELLTPALIAQALSGFFEFEGYGDEAAAEVLQDLASDLQSPAPTKPLQNPEDSTVVSASIRAVPQQLHRGETLDLELTYRIVAPAGQSVTVEETRSLLFNGQIIPGYPNTTRQSRASGEFSSTLKQTIPANAAAGNYEYRGEVCVQGECISRRELLEVL